MAENSNGARRGHAVDLRGSGEAREVGEVRELREVPH
jgi:hypothetical protein